MVASHSLFLSWHCKNRHNLLKRMLTTCSPQTSDSCKDCINRMLEKDPSTRITLDELKLHNWVTQDGTAPMLPMSQNCPDGPIEVDEEDIKNSIRTIPKLETLVSHKKYNQLILLRLNSTNIYMCVQPGTHMR